jgi:hypothetical protein
VLFDENIELLAVPVLYDSRVNIYCSDVVKKIASLFLQGRSPWHVFLLVSKEGAAVDRC